MQWEGERCAPLASAGELEIPPSFCSEALALEKLLTPQRNASSAACPSGIANLSRLIPSAGNRVRSPDPSDPLGHPLRTRDLGPTLASMAHFLTVCRGGQPVPARAEGLGAGPVGGEAALGLSGGLTVLPAPLPRARRLMRILRPIVQIAGHWQRYPPWRGRGRHAARGSEDGHV